MAIKLRIPSFFRKVTSKAGAKSRPQTNAVGWRRYEREIRLGVAGFIIFCLCFFAVFTYYYVKYERIVDKRMSGQIFAPSAKIYARPMEVDVGDKESISEIETDLRHAGYTEGGGKGSDSQVGHFELGRGNIQIHPGPQSYHNSDSAVIYVAEGKISRIEGANGADLSAYELEPQLVTALFQGEDRSKRQIVKFNDIPKVMVDAVLAIEDRRFFQHNGVNYYRLAEAGVADVVHRRRGQGGSTLTMQLSRGFFLTPEKTVKRKLTEMLIAIELEQRFSKPQIFELYANEVPMGQRGSFAISGLGEAARAYFNKDIKSLTLPEAALLAGLIQRPSYLSPYRHPERALDRRNLVLDSMVETGAITREDADRAKATPLKLAAPNVEASDAPYFVDMVKDFLSSKYSENEVNEHQYRVYTTIDPELQNAAADAVENGIKGVDEQVLKLRTHKVGKGKNAKTEVKPGPEAQVALVAIDPHTGEVLALVGGRNYGMSQLNHAVAKRPTGSIFKPFVYATAMNTAITGDPAQAVTPASLVDDSPTTFMYGDQIYEPRNYKEEYHGQVTARYALAMSLNNATVKLAEQVGYENVANLAKSAGIASVKATPAMALGAYDATPVDMAGAYTVFANNGTRISPMMVKSVRNAKGDVVDNFQNESHPVLDPRVAGIMTDMMQGVINFGTAYPVRQRGFTAPAAGKTGTSHDAWFAGYTSNLLCIVWVGYDDYSDIKLSGALAAAPIWTDFMKRASKLRQYSDMKPFAQPSGVVQVELDKVTNQLATPSCPETYTAEFVAGTEPKQTCDQALGDRRGFFSKIFGNGQQTVLPPPTSNGSVNNMPPAQTTTATQQQQQDQEKKKKGFFGKIAGFFKSDTTNGQQQTQPNQTDQTNQTNGNGTPH